MKKIIDELSDTPLPTGDVKLVAQGRKLARDTWHYDWPLQYTNTLRPLLNAVTYSAESVPQALAARDPGDLFALFDDGRAEGAVWFPVRIAAVKQS